MGVRKRCNVWVDVEQYQIFVGYSKLLKISFTDLVNMGLFQFNLIFGKTMQTGDKKELLELLSIQTKNYSNEIDLIKREMENENAKKVAE